MLARLRVLLPFEFSLPLRPELAPQEFELPPYHVRILPPCRAAIEPARISMTEAPLIEIAHSIAPAPTQPQGQVEVNGVPTVQANLFQIDFAKLDFDRRRSTIEGLTPATLELGDPSITFAFSVLNNWINRYRHLTRSVNVRVIRLEDTFWALEYLTDDAKPLPQDPVLFRFRTAGRHGVSVNVLDRVVWDRVGAVPFNSSVQAWEILLLDAPALLPEIGPAVVLAYAALEGFIDACLDKLAPLAKIPPGLWEWINTRDSFWLRPRTDEQFDVLLESLTGKSLKTETTLWELFRNLRSARHSYVHTGRPAIGGADLTLERATKLISGAGEIIAWAEKLLPEELRRQELGMQFAIKLTTTIPLVRAPAASPAEPNPRKHEN